MSNSVRGPPPLETPRSPPHSTVLSTDVLSGDTLASKYQRLFTDYTRIKAQQAVLKQAVVQVQQKNELLAQECSTQRAESRQYRNQMDTLEFNNRRLIKRLDVLQTAAAQQAKSQRGWLFAGTGTRRDLSSTREALEAISHELQAKINENESLHSELSETRAAFERQLSTLRRDIATLNNDKTKFQEQIQQTEGADRPKLKQYQKRVTELTGELDALQASQAELQTSLRHSETTLAYTRGQLQIKQRFVSHIITVLSSVMDNTQRFDSNILAFPMAIKNHFLTTITTLKQTWDALRKQIGRASAFLPPEVAQRHEALMQACIDSLGGSMLTVPLDFRPQLLDHLAKFLQWYFGFLLETASTTEFYRDTYQQLLQCASRFTQRDGHPDFAPYFALEEAQRIIADKVIEVQASPLREIAALIGSLTAVCLWKLYPWVDSTTPSRPPTAMDIFEIRPWPTELTAAQQLYDAWRQNYLTLRANHRKTTESLKQAEGDRDRLEADCRQWQRRFDEDKKKAQAAERFANQKQEKLTATLQQLSTEIATKDQNIASLESRMNRQLGANADLKDALQFHIDQFDDEKRHQAEVQQRLQNELNIAQRRYQELEKQTVEQTRLALGKQKAQFDALHQDQEQQRNRERQQLTSVITELTQQLTDLQESMVKSAAATAATVTALPVPNGTGELSRSTPTTPMANGKANVNAVNTPRSQVSPVPTEEGDVGTLSEHASPILPAVPENTDSNGYIEPTDVVLEEKPASLSPQPNTDVDVDNKPELPSTNPDTQAQSSALSEQQAEAFMLREQETAAYFQAQIARLNVQLEIADSKAVEFHKAWDLANRQLSQANSEKSALESRIDQMESRVAELEDELSTTKRGYEEQIQIMTESLTML
ncbi:hypothetical protein H4R33_000249 [Dimargaris cristalligena]|nr:hypothetical protein H4R33_000249 [Dimargaris cristalligena]